MALTKVTGDFIKAGVITQAHLHSSHGITSTHIAEGDKLFFTNARVDSRIGSLSTSNLSEGSNLYYTDARARAAISVSGNALSYNSSTGVITSNYEESPTFTGNVTIDDGKIIFERDANNEVALEFSNVDGVPDDTAKLKVQDKGLLWEAGGTNGAKFWMYSGTWNSTVFLNAGTFNIRASDSTGRAVFNSAGLTITNDLDVDGGNITLGGTGRIQGIDTVSANTDAANKLYVDNQVAGIVDSAPSTLDTLNELAAALGDDANFSTTVTNSIATKMPLAGGTFTGNVQFNDNVNLNIGSSADFKLYHDSSNSYIDNYTGSLLIRNTNDNYHVIIQSDNGGGGLADYFRAKGDTGEVILYCYGVEKFKTVSTGIEVTGDADVSGNVFVGSANSNFSENNLRFKSSGAAYIDHNTVGQSFIFRTSASSSLDTTALTIASNANATFAGNVTASSGTGHFSVVNASAYQLNGTYVMDSSRNLVNIAAITASGAVSATEYDLPSSGMLDWANGDARIVEGLVNNYSLSFQTWDGSAVSTALRLDGNNSAHFGSNIRASIFYDSNNTAYYVDPNSTGTSINVRGEIANPSVWINDGDNYNNYNENIRLFNAPNNVSVIAFSASGTSGTPTTSILGYSSYLEFRKGTQWQQRLGANYAEAYGDYRAPVFYDSNDTTYYINPAGTSYINEIRSGESQAAPRWDTAFYVLQAQHWYGDTSTQDMFIGESGNAVFLRGNLRTPIIYDSNDTTYYLDPASGNRFKGITEFRTSSGNARGYIQATETNDEHFIIATSGGEDIAFKDGGVSGDTNMIIRGNGDVFTFGNNYGRIWYDYDDTARYVDPTSLSRLNSLEIANTSNKDTPGALMKIGSDGFIFGGNNSGYEVNSAQISAGYHVGNSLNFVGMGTNSSNRRMDFWAEGGFYVTGNIYDKDATSYYADFGGTSVSLQVAGPIVSTGPTSGTTASNRAFQVNTTTKGALHSTAASGGTSGSADTAPLVTFTGNGTTVQGGIYVSQNSSTGTTLGFFVTDSYATGPKQSLTIEDGGNVFVNRGLLQASASVRGQQFYDTNNTSYYLDPASNSVLYDLTLTGSKHTYLYVNPGNGYEAMTRYNGGSGSTWYVGSRTSSDLVGSTDAWHVYSQTAGRTVSGTDTAGNTFAYGSSRAPIFYDSNDTGYYANPAGTSNFYNIETKYYGETGTGVPTYDEGGIEVITNGNGVPAIGFHRGGYSATTLYEYDGELFVNPWTTRAQSGKLLSSGNWDDYVFSGSWNGSNFPGSRWGGFGVNGGEIVFQRDNPSTGKMSIMVDGSFYAGENGAFWSIYSGNNYNNRVGIYGDSSGNLQIGTSATENVLRTAYGYVQVGPMNSSHAHLYTDRSNFYFNKQIQLLGGTLINQNDIRSVIFYDRSNTNYYCDPNGTSVLNAITMAGALQTAGSHTVGSSGTSNIYMGGVSGNYFRFHTNNSHTYFDGNVGDIHWRQGSSTRFIFYMTTANMTVNGTVTQYSDSRLKDNIITIDGALDKVNQLRGVYYNRTDINTSERQIGLVAQEVESVVPEVVHTANDELNTKSISYAQLNALLVEAIKELKADNDSLRARIETLENQ